MNRWVFNIVGVVVALGSFTGPARVLADAQNPTYDDDILPIAKQYCINCHGNDKQKGDLNLATYAAMNQGGSSGAVVVPGNPAKSRLYTLAAHLEEPKMPPSGNKIPDDKLAILKLWIEQGARANATSKVVLPPKNTDIGLKSIVKGRPEGPPPLPQLGQLKLDPIVRARRPGAILAMATSPWAPLVAIGGQKQVILYNTDTGELFGFLPFEHGQIHSLKFSRNAQLLLVAGGRGGQAGKAVLYKVQTGEKVLEVGLENDAILAADISADQTQIAVGSPSKIVRVYSTADGSVLHEIKKHTDWVTAVEFSPDGVLLATGDRNGGVWVWEAYTGREFFALRGHTAMITDLSWRDDSNVLATASEDASVRLWEMENGTLLKNWNAHPGGTTSIHFTHDGRLATTGRDKITKLWDQNGTLQKTFEALPDLGLQVAVTHDNARVIAGDWSGTVKAWTTADAKAVANFDANPPSAAERLKQAEAVVAALQTKLTSAQTAYDAAVQKAKTASDAHNAAVAKANKITADLASAQKMVTDATATATAAQTQMNAAKTAVDQATPPAQAAAAKAVAWEVLVNAENLAAKTLAEASAKAPDNTELATLAKKKAEVLAAATAEWDKAKKTATETAATLKTAQDQFALHSKTHAEAMAQVAAYQKKVAELMPMVKPATDAVAATKTALDAANAEVASTKATLDAANAELATAKATVEKLKNATAPASMPMPK
ncbi:MAG: c-type cytochrome domain-containing protein [Gemmataceae bacterium]|nr:hypothetical protein [Gemmata sp.]MDW8197352.1 c-type cytochrome domain-containing protein [Gemmataceae bacterium]